MQEQNEQPVFENEISPGMQSAFTEISKWTKFISVIGFALGGFVVMIMLVSGSSVLKALENAILIKVQGLYGALIVVFFIFFFIAAAVLYFLHQAANLLRQGVLQNNQTLIAEGFSSLKRFFIAVAIVGALGLVANFISLFN